MRLPSFADCVEMLRDLPQSNRAAAIDRLRQSDPELAQRLRRELEEPLVRRPKRMRDSA